MFLYFLIIKKLLLIIKKCVVAYLYIKKGEKTYEIQSNRSLFVIACNSNFC